jgi:hypothetical protein
MKKILSFFNKKKFKHGGVSVLFTAVFIAIIILINIIAGLVLDRLDISVDLTADRMFSIEADTVQYLSGLTDNVTIVVASRENDFINISGGGFYNQTNEILKRFAGASPNITLSYMDIMSNPNFFKDYEGAIPGSVIIKSQGTLRHKMLDAEDYFHATYYDLRNGNPISREDYQAMNSMGMSGMVTADVSAGAEIAFLSAILSVTDTNPINVGFTTGYAETKNEQLELNLQRYAYTNREVDLVTEDIDPKLDMIIIHSPKTDYSQDTLNKLDKWLDNNNEFGKTLIYISHEFAETPNIDTFLFDWGIKVERAYVRQTDPLAGPSLQRFTPQEFTDGLNAEYDVLGIFIRHTNQLFEANRNMKTRSILFSDDSALFPFEAIPTDSDNEDDEDNEEEFDFSKAERGEFSIGVISSKTHGMRDMNDEEVNSNVVVFGGSDIFIRDILVMQNAANADFFINMMNEISGKNQAEFVPNLTPKSFAVPTFNITEGQLNGIGTVFVFVLPTIVIATGVVVWVRRIRK